MDQSKADIDQAVIDEVARLIMTRFHDVHSRPGLLFGCYRSAIKDIVLRPMVRKIVNDSVKAVSDRTTHSHKLKGPQAAAQRQMQRKNARKAMCEKAFGARQ